MRYGIVGGMVREKHGMWYGTLAVWYDGTVSWIYYMAKHRMCVVWYCWRYGTGNTHSMRYGTLAVCYDGTVSWIYYLAKFAWWYGMFRYIRSVRVEYVVRISPVTTLPGIYRHTDHWKVFKNISRADRQTDRQVSNYRSWYSVLQTENNRDGNTVE